MMGRKCRSLLLLPQVLGQILLVVNQAESSPADKTIRIGYLLQHMTRAGAINVAIERAQNDGLLRDYNFRYYFCIRSAGLPETKLCRSRCVVEFGFGFL